MIRHATRIPLALCTVFALLALAACGGGQEAPKGSGGTTGWEQGGEFDRKYNIAEFDKIKGAYAKTESITPLPGMAEGVAVVVKDRADGQPITVVLGPKSYVAEKLGKLSLRDGERLNAYGAWARVGEKDVLIATKLKKTEKEFLKVRRTKDGVPFWALSDEEIAKETEGNDE